MEFFWWGLVGEVIFGAFVAIFVAFADVSERGLFLRAFLPWYFAYFVVIAVSGILTYMIFSGGGAAIASLSGWVPANAGGFGIGFVTALLAQLSVGRLAMNR